MRKAIELGGAALLLSSCWIGVDDNCLELDHPRQGEFRSVEECRAASEADLGPILPPGAMNFKVDYDDGVAYIEYEVEKSDGRVVSVKENWRLVR